MFNSLLLVFMVFLIAGTALPFLLTVRANPVVDPTAIAAEERLATDDDIVSARTEFDRMLIEKGLLTDEQLELIRFGTRSPAVVTGMRTTGHSCEDFREVELDVMVKRSGGGQFAAHETALVPASALTKVSPGSVIDTYYRSGDESAVAVCVPPR